MLLLTSVPQACILASMTLHRARRTTRVNAIHQATLVCLLLIAAVPLVMRPDELAFGFAWFSCHVAVAALAGKQVYAAMRHRMALVTA